MNFTDAATEQEIQENAYMQYFLGLHAYRDEPLFDSSMMVHIRKRFSVNSLAKINECICTGRWPEESRNVDRNKEDDEDHDDLQPPSDEADSQDGGGTHKRWQKGQKNRNTSKKKAKKRKKKNHGNLILDATVAPADIKYPTDLDLLNKSREHLEHAIDLLWPYVPHTSHKLPYSSKIARKSYLNLAKSKKWTKAKCRKAVGEQLHRDACERNVVESRNGNAKRRFGLDRIMAKLDETAKTEAILNIIAMNAARRVARWLALFFRFWTSRLA